MHIKLFFLIRSSTLLKNVYKQPLNMVVVLCNKLEFKPRAFFHLFCSFFKMKERVHHLTHLNVVTNIFD